MRRFTETLQDYLGRFHPPIVHGNLKPQNILLDTESGTQMHCYLSIGVDVVLSRLTRPDPGDRYATAGEAVNQLAHAFHSGQAAIAGPVFLSYARTDRDYAHALAALLRSVGVDLWETRRREGQPPAPSENGARNIKSNFGPERPNARFGVTIGAVTKKICIASAFLFTCVVGATGLAHPQAQSRGQNAGELELVPVQGNIHMLAGAGGNITVQTGRDGILLVDSGVAAMSEKVVEAIRTLSRSQVTYIVNTSDRGDHVGGNETFARSGRPLAIGRAAQASVFIIAFSTILERMSDRNAKPPIPDRAWPNDTYSVPQKNLYFNGEGIQIFHQPATTDGDSIVVFRRSDVISTGDMFDPTQYPIIDVKNGGSLQGVVEGLNRLRQMAIPADHVEGGTMIVPGHGRLCDTADLSIYHQMVTIVRDRLQDMIARGMTLEQVRAARPTRDYDPVYGSDTGTWTRDMFIEAAYRSLSSKPTTSGGRGSN